MEPPLHGVSEVNTSDCLEQFRYLLLLLGYVLNKQLSCLRAVLVTIIIVLTSALDATIEFLGSGILVPVICALFFSSPVGVLFELM